MAGLLAGARVRALGEADAADFWAVRLRAVREHPRAFGWTAEEVLHMPPAERARRFRDDWLEGGVMLGAFVDHRLVGTLGLARPSRAKRRHRGEIRSVYVAPEARGAGIAAALLAEAIRRAGVTPGLEVLGLSVGEDNAPARRLYERFGFEAYGVEHRALKVDGGYVDEVLMALRLDRTAAPKAAG